MESTLAIVVDPVVVSTIKAKTSAGLSVQSNNGTLVVDFGPGGGAGAAFADGITCSSITATGASGITDRQAATQDGIQLLGRAGGTSSYVGTLTPTTLTASRTYTFPDAAIVVSGSASALTSGRVPYVTTGGLLTDSIGATFSTALAPLPSTSSGYGLTLGDGSTATNAFFDINTAAGRTRAHTIRTAGNARWAWGASGAAESGGDVGSSYFLAAYTDAGALIDNPITIVRASGGAISIARPLTSTGVVTVPNGSAAAPGLRLTSEASGLFRSSATVLGFTVNGTQSALLSSAGIFNASYLQGFSSADAGTVVGAFSNSSAGTAAYTRVYVGQDQTTSNLELRYYGGGYTTAATYNIAASVALVANAGATGGLTLVTRANADMRFYTQDALRATVTGAGAWNFASTVPVSIANTTASTSTTTGALVVSGGVGVAGAVNAGGNVVGTNVYGNSTTNYATTGTSSNITPTETFRYNGAGAATLQGFNSGAAGRMIFIYNNTANTLTLEHSNTTEATANRAIICPGAANLDIVGLGGAILKYDNGQWRVVATTN